MQYSSLGRHGGDKVFEGCLLLELYRLNLAMVSADKAFLSGRGVVGRGRQPSASDFRNRVKARQWGALIPEIGPAVRRFPSAFVPFVPQEGSIYNVLREERKGANAQRKAISLQSGSKTEEVCEVFRPTQESLYPLDYSHLSCPPFSQAPSNRTLLRATTGCGIAPCDLSALVAVKSAGPALLDHGSRVSATQTIVRPSKEIPRAFRVDRVLASR
jgi:hypothetical protein